jgi:hypothetical protein
VRVLLDNCVPAPLCEFLTGHQVTHAARIGFERLFDGELLRALAATGFEAVLTLDKNVLHQQNLARLPLPVVLVVSPDTRVTTLAMLVPAMLAVLNQSLQPKVYVVPGE